MEQNKNPCTSSNALKRKRSASTISILRDQQINGHIKPSKYVHNSINNVAFPYFTDLSGHYGCVNTVAFSHGQGRYLVTGSDDTRVLLWEPMSRKPKPIIELLGHKSNVFSALFDSTNRFVLTAGNDAKIFRYDLEFAPKKKKTGGANWTNSFEFHGSSVYKVSYRYGDDNIFASSSEDGYFAIWDIRTKKPSGVVFARGGFNSVDFSPVDPNLLVSAHTKDGVKLWDLRTSLGGGRLRKPHSKSFNTYGNNNISGAYFNKFGNQIIASVKGGYPTLFSTLSEEPLCVMYSDSYRNMCTLKSCTFIGSDHEYIVSGSDDFRIYGWKIPADFDLTSTTYNSRHRVIRNELIESSVDNDASSEDNESEDVVEPSAKRRRVENKPETVKLLESHGAYVVSQPRFVLTGHKSIVNNIAYHPSLPLMVSSGVEKVIKMWSPYPITSEHREPMKVRRRQPYLFTNPSFANYFDMLPTLRDNENSVIESEQTLALFDFFNRCASVDGDEDDDDDDEIGANLMNIIGEGDSFEEDDEDASSSDQINESDLRRLIPQDINVTFMDDNEDYTDDIQDLEPSSDEMDYS